MNWNKYIKLILGTICSVLLAHIFHLQYAYASGIITLLTIQDTKRETMIIAIKRLFIFGIMTLLSILIFPICGYTIRAFAILLIPYLLVCLLLDMNEAIAPIAVLCTHYISAKSCDISMILNELGILLLGAGIGIIINLFYQNNLPKVKQKQAFIDERMKIILKRMAFYINETDKSLYTNECFLELDQLIEDLRKESLRYMNNHFLGKNDYFYHYMLLRLRQLNLLKRIYTDITRIEIASEYTIPISEFLARMALEFHEKNLALELNVQLTQLNEFYAQQALPISRIEFENRAILYHIMKDLEEFIELKRAFMEPY